MYLRGVREFLLPWSPDDSFADTSLAIYGAATGELQARFASQVFFDDLRFHPLSAYLATKSWPQPTTYTVYDTGRRSLVAQMQVDDEQSWGYLENGRCLLADAQSIRLVDAVGGAAIASIDAGSPIRRPCYCNAGRTTYRPMATADGSVVILTSDEHGEVALWDLQADTVKVLAENHWSVAMSGDRRWVASASPAGQVTVWDSHARMVFPEFKAPPKCDLRFTHDGAYLMATLFGTSGAPSITAISLQGGQQIEFGEPSLQYIFGGEFSPNGRHLVMGDTSGAPILVEIGLP
jgi:WD40 repeat protein